MQELTARNGAPPDHGSDATSLDADLPPIPSHQLVDLYLCPWMVAGVRTQYENLRRFASQSAGARIHYVEITPWIEGGWIEGLPLLGKRTKGSMRSMLCSLPLFSAPATSVIWAQVATPLFPFYATRGRLARIPYVIATDATTAQVESFSEYGLKAISSWQKAKHRVRDWLIAYSFTHARYVLPWSQWAAQGIQSEFGVPTERIRVMPPGVDPSAWQMRKQATAPGGSLTRLLFVGGDWERKGGPLLLDVFRTHLRGRCELHLVTRDAPADVLAPDVFVYPHFGPNDPGLRRLYEICDALVLPTRADCFSLASIEAMASGLPVITCPVGGIPEIVEDGTSGLLVPVGDGVALRAAIEALLSDPAHARAMGRRGRAIVEERFDAAKNTQQVLDLLRTLHAQHAQDAH